MLPYIFFSTFQRKKVLIKNIIFSKNIIFVLIYALSQQSKPIAQPRSNPPEDDDSIPLNKERTRDESADKPIESWGGFAYYINPFFQINKKGVAKLYDQFGLTRRLFPLTYSCEGPADRTNTHTQHCGKCWWCLERVWAFGFLTCEIETSLPQFIYD